MTTQALSHEDKDIAVADLPQEQAPEKGGNRKRLFAGLALGVLVLGGGYKAYDVLVASRHAETDNAYVGADVAQVTPLLDATVTQVLVSDSQTVKQGDILVKLDDTDARIALEGAEAQLALTERRVKGLSATDLGLGAQVAARAADEARAQAQLVSAKADLDRAAIDLKRREALAASGSVSGEELSSARNAFASAGANLRAAQAAIAQAGASRRGRHRHAERQQGADRAHHRNQPRGRGRARQPRSGPRQSGAHGDPRAGRWRDLGPSGAGG
jgi:membrane fusion protein (multidrug efflux system)